MEKLIEYFKDNHEGKNWTLFLITLGVVHSAWWFGTFDFIKKFGTQNPYFIFLEILFIASGITRFLIVIDIFYIIETCPGISDCITFLWKKRRDEWYKWSVTESPLKESVIKLLMAMNESHENYEMYDMHTAIYDQIIMNAKLPNHIIYWIKLTIKEYTPQKSFLDKTIIVGKKLIKYILSHVQKH